MSAGTELKPRPDVVRVLRAVLEADNPRKEARMLLCVEMGMSTADTVAAMMAEDEPKKSAASVVGASETCWPLSVWEEP